MSVIRPDQAPAAADHARASHRTAARPPASTTSWWSTSPPRSRSGVRRSSSTGCCGRCDPSRIVVGENFRFGFRAAGDGRRRWPSSGRGDFEVDAVPLLTDGTQPSSSTADPARGGRGRLRPGPRTQRSGVPVHRGGRRSATSVAGRWAFPTANVPVAPGMAVPGRRGLRRLGDPAGHPVAPLAGGDLGRHQPDLRRRRTPGRGVRAGPRRPRAVRGRDRHRLLRPAPRAR